MEHDPHGLEQHALGAKNDAGKLQAGVVADFSHALLAVATVGDYGANKYTRRGWEYVKDGENRYWDAFWRHLLKDRIEPEDAESGLPHLWHALWNLMAVIELKQRRSR